MNKFYTLKISETGVVSINDYVEPVKDTSFGAMAVLFLTEIDDATMKNAMDTLGETRVVSIKIVNAAGATKEQCDDIEKKLRLRFPFRNCLVDRNEYKDRSALEVYKSFDRTPEVFIIDSGAYECIASV